jgi:hypothetical protein
MNIEKIATLYKGGDIPKLSNLLHLLKDAPEKILDLIAENMPEYLDRYTKILNNENNKLFFTTTSISYFINNNDAEIISSNRIGQTLKYDTQENAYKQKDKVDIIIDDKPFEPTIKAPKQDISPGF